MNACGKFPSSRPAFGSYSSEIRPRSFVEPEQPLEQRVRVVVAAEQLETVDEPERAREEHAFAGRQSVDAVVSAVAEYETVLDQLALDRLDGAAHARVRSGQKADERNQ